MPIISQQSRKEIFVALAVLDPDFPGAPDGWEEYEFISSDRVERAKEFFKCRTSDISYMSDSKICEYADIIREVEIFKYMHANGIDEENLEDVVTFDMKIKDLLITLR
jgi:hypothetical protein